MSLAALGRDAEGLSNFEQALAIAPEFSPALKGAIESAYRTRDTRAGDLVDRLLRLDPRNGVAHAMAGTLRYEAGDCRGAIAHFEQSLEQIAANEDASSLYAACLLSQNRPDDATRVLQPFTCFLTRQHPPGACSQPPRRSADCWKRPSAHYKKAIEAAPSDEQNYVDLATLYIQHEAASSALPVVDAALQHSPNSPRLHAMRGVIKGQIGLDDEAAAEFERANRLDPKGELGSPGLGVLYASSNQIERSGEVLRERLKKTPDDPTLNYLLAETLIRGNIQNGTPEFAEALSSLRRAIRIKPDFAGAHSALGKLYNRVGDYPRAVAELKAGVAGNPSDRAALSQLAVALRHLGRTAEAAEVSADLRRVVLSDTQKPAAATPEVANVKH